MAPSTEVLTHKSGGICWGYSGRGFINGISWARYVEALRRPRQEAQKLKEPTDVQ